MGAQGAVSIGKVTAPTVLRALELVPRELIFPLDEKEFFSTSISSGIRVTKIGEEGGA
jgi:hypothetical protein